MYDNWLLVSFSMMRALYSAAIEAFVTWALTILILPYFSGTLQISYLTHYIFWFIVGTIVACFQYKDLLK